MTTMSFAGYQDLSGTRFAISPRPFSVILANLTWIPILAFLIIAIRIPGVFSFLYIIVNFWIIWQWINKFHWHEFEFRWTLYIIASGVILMSKFSFQLVLCYHGDNIRSCDVLEGLGVGCPTGNWTVPSVGVPCPLKNFDQDILWDVVVFGFLLVMKLCYCCISQYHTQQLDQYCRRWYNRRDAFVETASQLVRKNRDAADRRQRELKKQGEDLMTCNQEQLFRYFRDTPMPDEENRDPQLQIQDGNVQRGEDQNNVEQERDPLLNHGQKSIRQRLLLTMSDWAGLYHLVAKRFELEDVTAIDELRRRIEEEIMDNSRTWRNFWSMFWQIFLHLLAFIWPFVVFILMVLHTVLEGNLISLVYPLLIFCWGLLTVPRPSIRFWKCVTLFTMFVMIVKHICRLSFLPWNSEGLLATWNPYYLPQFIGIERSSTYGALHLVILIFLLIQCYFLRRYGMWPQEQQQQQRRTEDEVRDQGQQADESDGIHRFAPDLYGWAFLCDITILIILLVDFNSFTSSDVLEAGGVTTYFIYDKVPWSFVILLFGWFCDLIVERTLYIIRKRKGKIGFHIIITVVVHGVVFGFLPHYHQRCFCQNHTAQLWYAVRCISFALSAHQIKYGYPDNVHGHACAKNYSFFHAWVFKGYLAVPFLMEIRTLLGWACTTTCFSRRQWFQCEDIYARVYIAKYDKIKDKKEDSTKSLKEWAEAFLLFVVLLLPICLPLVLFSIYTEGANTNPPTLATLTVSIGGYEPIFRSTATFGRSIHSLTSKDLEDLANLYPSHGEAAQFIMGHHPEDVSRIDFDGLSLSNWDITPDSLQELKNDLSGDLPYPFWLDFDVKFKRKPDGKHYDELWGRFNVDLSPRKYAGVRHSLLDAISNGSSDTPIQISDVFPRYLHLGRYAEVQPVNLLSQGPEKYGINLWQYSNDTVCAKWWLLGEIQPSCHNDNKVGHNSPPKVRIITFNDRINTDSTLSVMSKFGLLSLYAGVVLALHRLIRGSITEDHRTLMFRQLIDFEPLIRLFSALHRMIELKDLPAQRRLYEFLISLYADPARLREFTSSRQQDPQPAD